MERVLPAATLRATARSVEQCLAHLSPHHRWLIADVKGQPTLAQPGVTRGEALEPALVLEPGFVDEVLDVAAGHRRVAEQAPRQRALAQARASRLLHHAGELHRP